MTDRQFVWALVRIALQTIGAVVTVGGVGMLVVRLTVAECQR